MAGGTLLYIAGMRKYLPIFVLLLCSVFSFTEELPELVPRAALFGNPERMSPQISPDGNLLAWIAPSKGVLNIWVRRLQDGPDDTRVVTADSKRGIREFLWRGDSRHIIYFQDQDGDENWNLFQIPVEGDREARNLTPGPFQAKVIANLPQYPDQMVLGWNERDSRVHDAYLLDLNTGKRTLLAENPGDVEYYIADNKLRVRAALARLKDGSAEIRVRENEQSSWRHLAGWTDQDVDGELFAFSEDDGAVWYTSSVGSDTGQLLETDVATGTTRVLASDETKQFDVGKILVDSARRTLEAVQFNREHSDWEAQNPRVAADFNVLRKLHRGDFEVLNSDNAGRYW